MKRSRARLDVIAAVLALSLAKACSSAPHAPAARSNEAPRVMEGEAASEPQPIAQATDAGVSANPESPATAAPAAAAEPDAGAPKLTAADVLALSPSVSTSIGSPGAGEVKGAVALPDEGPGFRHNDRRPYEARFGTVELVQALIRAAAASPEDVVVINDIGLEHGGPIRQHGSHQSGRDVDVLFFSTDLKGKPVPSVGVPIDPKGRGIDFKDLAVRSDDVDLRFDAKRTWRFVAALLEATGDDLQRIFIVEHVRTMLLAEAARVKAKKKIVERFEMLTCQPGTPHDDHMHIRWFCSAEDIAAGCVDSPPMMPFRRQAMKKLGVTPVLETYATRHEKKRVQGVDDRTTSMAEARAKIEKSGPMHPRVRRFLDEREAWAVKPSVGRPYCK